jgi:hypothetical protein
MKSFSPAGMATKAYYGLGARTFGNPDGARSGGGAWTGVTGPQRDGGANPNGPNQGGGSGGGGGSTWTQIVTGFESGPNTFDFPAFVNSNWVIVAHGNSRPVAVIYSNNLVNWSENLIDNFLTTGLGPRGMAYGGAIAVYAIAVFAVGSGTKVYSSSSLSNTSWTLAAVPGFTTTDPCNGIAWSPGAGVFLVTTELGRYATSPDGVTWTHQTAYAPSQLSAPIYDGSDFVVMSVHGGAGKVAVSSDGVSWTEIATLTFNSVASGPIVAQAPGNYVCGDPNSDNGNTVISGVVTPFNFNSPGNASTGLAYGLGSYAWINNNTGIPSSSSNGTTWFQDTVPSDNIAQVAYGTSPVDVFLACGSFPNVLVSRNP